MLNLYAFSITGDGEGPISIWSGEMKIMASGSVFANVERLCSFNYFIWQDFPHTGGVMRLTTSTGTATIAAPADEQRMTYQFPAPYTGPLTITFGTTGEGLGVLEMNTFLTQ